MPADPDIPTRSAPRRADLPPFELLGPAHTAELDAYVRAAQEPPLHRRPILVQGEVGTWKTRWAECLHEQSDKATSFIRQPFIRLPFIRLHCGLHSPRRTEDLLFEALPSSRAPSAWQRARGGTLLLEDVQQLPDDAQLELAERLVDADRPQVIATTSAPLDLAVRSGRFDPGLYRLFASQMIVAPPLVRCRRDLMRIIESLLHWHAESRDVSVPRLTETVSRAALEHDWPGNLRELDSRVERALLTASYGSLDAGHLGLTPRDGNEERSLTDRLKSYERRVLQECLAATGGDLEETCRRLGLNRRGLLYRLKKHGLEQCS